MDCRCSCGLGRLRKSSHCRAVSQSPSSIFCSTMRSRRLFTGAREPSVPRIHNMPPMYSIDAGEEDISSADHSPLESCWYIPWSVAMTLPAVPVEVSASPSATENPPNSPGTMSIGPSAFRKIASLSERDASGANGISFSLRMKSNASS